MPIEDISEMCSSLWDILLNHLGVMSIVTGAENNALFGIELYEIIRSVFGNDARNPALFLSNKLYCWSIPTNIHPMIFRILLEQVRYSFIPPRQINTNYFCIIERGAGYRLRYVTDFIRCN